MNSELHILSLADAIAEGKSPEVVFWVGCMGSFDDRAKRITRAVANILNAAQVSFAILGAEETCSGDPAKRSGNEYLFQMQAFQNISKLNQYNVKTLVTACPHCFNTLKHEYPQLGGQYHVMHHTEFIQNLLDTGKIKLKDGAFKGKKIVYHDPCYLGRVNGIYEAPRDVIEALDADLAELEKSRANGMCCGAGGAQMFKEAESGTKEVNVARTEDLLSSQPDVIAVACPFCTTMITDGVKHFNKEHQVNVLDVSELTLKSMDA